MSPRCHSVIHVTYVTYMSQCHVGEQSTTFCMPASPPEWNEAKLVYTGESTQQYTKFYVHKTTRYAVRHPSISLAPTDGIRHFKVSSFKSQKFTKREPAKSSVFFIPLLSKMIVKDKVGLKFQKADHVFFFIIWKKVRKRHEEPAKIMWLQNSRDFIIMTPAPISAAHNPWWNWS